MRPLSLFVSVGLTLIAMTSGADAAGRRTRYVTGIDAGPPYGYGADPLRALARL
jgi:hypothetical protein